MAPWILLLSIIFFFLVLYFTAAYLQKRGLLYRNPRNSSASSVGAALMELNAIMQPRTSHAIEAIQMRPLLREEEGEGDDYGKYVVHLPKYASTQPIMSKNLAVQADPDIP